MATISINQETVQYAENNPCFITFKYYEFPSSNSEVNIRALYDKYLAKKRKNILK